MISGIVEQDLVQGSNQLSYGSGRVAGTVTELGVPGAYKVLLFLRTGALIAETLSDQDGNYVFSNLDPNGSYMVVAQDHGPNPVNAAISDYVTPEPMDV